MGQCTELCTQDTTGSCVLCTALAERDRFERVWFQGGLCIDGLQGLRQWWYPAPQAVVRHPDIVREAHKQYSETINKVMFTLLGVAVFCWVTVVSSSDHKLLTVTDSTIKIPVIDAQFSFVGFLVFAPFLLLVLTGYLHIFFRYWMVCERERQLINLRLIPPIESIPTLFSFPDAVSRFLTGVIFYRLVPVVLGTITWKAWVDPIMGLSLTYVTGIVTCVLILIQICYRPNSQRRWWTHLGYLPLVFVIGLMFAATVIPESFQRSLNFLSAELPKASFVRKNLSRVYARFANLREANFREANLYGADLQEADLQAADLQRANLRRADLQRANLQQANLQQADLQVADLQAANLQAANLRRASLLLTNLQGANLQRTDLQRTDLRGANLQAAYLQGADLQGADLQAANLQQAYLGGANLQQANLGGANLRGAYLGGADFTEAKNLTQDQLDTACSDENTRLPADPPGLRLPPCSK